MLKPKLFIMLHEMDHIGNVLVLHINYMNDVINIHGAQAFKSAVWHGAFLEDALSYVHPADELRETENFSLIQEAFIDAIV